MGVLTRLSGLDALPPGHFRANDAYLYQWQAGIISKQGALPARDMHRWMPFGRDNGQLLSLYAYALAYTHKAIVLLFPKVTLYTVQLLAPVVCFTLGLLVLLLFLNRCYGPRFALIVGVLLATLPGSIARSAAGFSDRDAWCWMLGVLALTSYLWEGPVLRGAHCKSQSPKFLLSAISGFTVFLGGLSWEGFGIFVLIILCGEFWRFCTTDGESSLTEYCVWVLMFVPWLIVISPAYHSGYGFSTHVTPLMLVPPVGLLCLRVVRYVLLRYVVRIRPHARKLAGGLTLLGLAAGGIYLWDQSATFETTAFVFRESALMKSVTELDDPTQGLWIDRFGALFVLGSLGGIAVCVTLWKKRGIPLAFALALFTITTFFRECVSHYIGTMPCNTLFFISLLMILISLAIAGSRGAATKNETFTLSLLAWFILWGSLARHGIRYCFFMGVPLSIGSGVLLWQIGTQDKAVHLFGKRIPTRLGEVGITALLLGILLFWPPLGGFATGTMQMEAQRSTVPGNRSLQKTYEWIKTHLPRENTVMAAHWTYGSQLNVLAGVKTINDQDHYSPFQIHLYLRYAFATPSKLTEDYPYEASTLAFLKTHNVTHLMMTSQELFPNAYQNSYIGSITQDEHFYIQKLRPVIPPLGTQYRLEPHKIPLNRFFDAFTSISTLQWIDVKGTKIENLYATAHFENRTYYLPYVAFIGEKRIVSQVMPENTNELKKNKITGPVISGGKPYRGGLVLFFDTDKQLQESYYIRPRGWNTLAVRLFYRGQHSDAFELVHTQAKYGQGTPPDIQIWKINYPENLALPPFYLRAEPPPRYEWGTSFWERYKMEIPQHSTDPEYRSRFERDF